MRVTLAAICLALAFAAPAVGERTQINPATGRATTFDIGPDITTNSRIRADLVRAARYWRAKPGCPVTVGVMDDDGDTFARADRGGCRIWIDRGWWDSLRAQPRLLCNVVVHEYGHLLGHGHDHRRRIMRPVDPDGARWVRVCRPAR